MKARDLGLVLLFILSVVGFEGCMESSGKFIITTNRNVPACGVDDPLIKTAWLSEFCTKHTPTDFTGVTITISVYANKTTKENHFIISYVSTELVDYSSMEVYDCSGNKLFFKSMSEPTPAGWDEFLAQNEIVATIWELKKK